MNTLENLLATVKIPLADIPIKCEITILSDELTIHQAKLFGINGIEYFLTSLNSLNFTALIEKNIQHLVAIIS